MTGVGIVVYGYLVEQKVLFLLGIAGVVFGLIVNVRYAIQLYSLNHWVSLGLLGIVIILGASVLERHHPRLRGLGVRWRRRFKGSRLLRREARLQRHPARADVEFG